MQVNSFVKIKSIWKRPIFYHWMTAPLFNAGTFRLANIRSYYTLDTCPKESLTAWLLFQGVQDGDSYHNYRRWLLYEGYRKEFNELAAARHLLPAEPRDMKSKLKLNCVHQLIHVTPPATIAAFDFALLVALNRVGERLNMLGDREASSSNMEAVKILQSKYSSWYEFHSGCIAGAYFRNPPVDTSTLLPLYRQSLLDFSRISTSIPWDYPF